MITLLFTNGKSMKLPNVNCMEHSSAGTQLYADKDKKEWLAFIPNSIQCVFAATDADGKIKLNPPAPLASASEGSEIANAIRLNAQDYAAAVKAATQAPSVNPLAAKNPKK